MRVLNDSDTVLTRMIELLRLGAFDDWAVALEKIKMDFDRDQNINRRNYYRCMEAWDL